MVDLPFVVEKDGKKDWWNVCTSGDSIADAQIGRDYADTLIQFMMTTGNTAALGWVVRRMISSGEYGPIEIAFTQRMGDRLCAAQIVIA